ncbi:MAG: hypothetical protein HOP29_19505 [Phycisphaerales bacterium]|nr:hypothetical protein [Phycisphaerales bacterium]
MGVQWFVTGWQSAAERLVSSAFQSPAELKAAADAAGVRETDLPDYIQRDAFAFGYVYGSEFPNATFTIADTERAIDFVTRGFGLRRDDVAAMAWCTPSAALAGHYAAIVREYSLRASLYRAAERCLADPRPIAEIARELLSDAVNSTTRGIPPRRPVVRPRVVVPPGVRRAVRRRAHR